MTTTLLNPGCDTCYYCCIPCNDYGEDPYSPSVSWYVWAEHFAFDSSLMLTTGGTYQWLTSDLHTLINTFLLSVSFTGPTPNASGWDDYFAPDTSLGSVEANGTVEIQETGYPAQSRYVRFHDFKLEGINIKQFCNTRNFRASLSFKCSDTDTSLPITQNHVIQFDSTNHVETSQACDVMPLPGGPVNRVHLHNSQRFFFVSNPGSLGRATLQVTLPLTSYAYDPLNVYQEFDGQFYAGTTPP